MLLNICKGKSTGVFQPEYRNQLLTTLSVTIITFCHGIMLGWLSPMLPKLQEISETPVDFIINVDEASWIASLLSVGAITGNILYGLLLERVGRKTCIFLLAFPNMCFWVMIYFAQSIEYLYIARFFGGLTGGGVYIVIPIFVSEIANSTIRGRLASLFALTQNTGILVGFIVSSHVNYHLVPCIIITLPILFLVLATFYPETAQHLLRRGRDEEARESFKFYQNFMSTSKEDFQKFNADFVDLRTAITQQKSEHQDVGVRNFFTKRSLKAFSSGIMLLALCTFAGHFAIINYMSSIFALTKSEIHPDTNTIIIGVVQIIGTYAAINLVDRYGRKILLIVSSSGMGVGLVLFGMYAFYAEEIDADLSNYSWWLPLSLMALIIFISNVGLNSITFVVLVEIMPPKCFWVMIYFAQSIEYLYIARFFGGLTGGGVYIVIPIFVSEIANSTIRGRLASLFALTQNTGILVGFIVSSHVNYHLVPCIIITLPILFLVLATFYPETAQHLLRRGRDEEARESFKFYQNFMSTSKEDFQKFNADFVDLRTAITQQKSEHQDVGVRNFFTKRSLKAFSSGIMLLALCTFAGHFAIINYMSSIFALTKSEIHPDTNTIIIGVVQIIGTYAAINLVDRYGRKILLIVSSSGMGVGLVLFGMYAFYAEEIDADLSNYSWWLPLSLMALIIFISNVGLNSITFVVLVEIMPPKIRSVAVTVCLTISCFFGFILLKIFPIFMATFGLSASMWFCATVCAFGLFYVTIFIPETKGKSMDKDDAE